ncbi:hypothetical protein AWC14_14645 [Mycobacterium kyorinense]|uniref:Uncharacterized protein n=1 Tax=Mycobacterium kyorinense TaxID=487514 RepID=A0A1X1XFU9_9MYCO|nr:hypothetical protein AWC14_14645 [Mycobacterium kyorinense]
MEVHGDAGSRWSFNLDVDAVVDAAVVCVHEHFVDEICSSFCARSYCSDLVVAGDGHLAPFVVADILLPERILRV